MNLFDNFVTIYAFHILKMRVVIKTYFLFGSLRIKESDAKYSGVGDIGHNLGDIRTTNLAGHEVHIMNSPTTS
jgi:hypothetical protein